MLSYTIHSKAFIPVCMCESVCASLSAFVLVHPRANGTPGQHLSTARRLLAPPVAGRFPLWPEQDEVSLPRTNTQGYSQMKLECF